MHRIDAILLASGFSRRFQNGNKLLHNLKGRPLASYTLELVSSLPFFRIHFVAANREVLRLAEAYPKSPIMVQFNSNPARGQCESIRLGVEASSAEYYMFFVCDQPLLDQKTVNAVIEKAAPGKIVHPTFEGQPKMPSLFSNAFRNELLALADGENARSIKKRHPNALIEVPIKTKTPLQDVDTLQDFDILPN